MRVLLAAFGSRGDVQPMLALAHGLRAAGHVASFCTPPDFEAWIRGHGFAVKPVGKHFETFIRDVGLSVRRALPMMRDAVSVQFRGLEAAVDEADVVVGSALHVAGKSLAEKRGIPYVYVLFSPSLLPSRAHPSPTVPWQGLPAWMNTLSWHANRLLWNTTFRASLNDERAALGLAPVQDLWAHVVGGDCLLASEPAFATVPADVRGSHVTQTGAWFLPETEELDPALEAFLNDGPAPVYIGFGSMTDGKPAETSRTILEAVRRAGVRALISQGWAGLGAKDLPAGVRILGPVPHGKLFPRVAAVIHHGGAGTTTAAARAGVPQLLIPHLLDQNFWADRVARLGISPRPIGRAVLTAEKLAAALTTCVTDETMRARARELGRVVVRDGVERAVRVIEGLGGRTQGQAA